MYDIPSVKEPLVEFSERLFRLPKLSLYINPPVREIRYLCNFWHCEFHFNCVFIRVNISISNIILMMILWNISPLLQASQKSGYKGRFLHKGARLILLCTVSLGPQLSSGNRRARKGEHSPGILQCVQ